MLRVNVGCGQFYATGWENVDRVRNEQVNPDVVAGLANLPYADATVDRVYAGHVLEHVALDAFDAHMAEVGRVLAPTGSACFVGPDVYKVLDDWKHDRCGFDLVMRALEGPDSSCGGTETWDGSCHTFNASEARVVGMVRRTFPAAYAVPILAAELDEWPVPFRETWQWAIIVPPTIP